MNDFCDVRNRNKLVEVSGIKKIVQSFLLRILLAALLVIVTLISIKSYPTLKSDIYQHLYTNNWNFAGFNKWYENTIGNFFPLGTSSEMVFQETLSYNHSSLYKNGVMLEVADNYLVPSLDEGIIVFIGEKEEFGNTIIVQQTDGVNVWYSNIVNNNLGMYDYIEKGMLIGEANNGELYLVFEKEGEFLDYSKYIS